MRPTTRLRQRQSITNKLKEENTINAQEIDSSWIENPIWYTNQSWTTLQNFLINFISSEKRLVPLNSIHECIISLKGTSIDDNSLLFLEKKILPVIMRTVRTKIQRMENNDSKWKCFIQCWNIYFSHKVPVICSLFRYFQHSRETWEKLLLNSFIEHVALKLQFNQDKEIPSDVNSKDLRSLQSFFLVSQVFRNELNNQNKLAEIYKLHFVNNRIFNKEKQQNKEFQMNIF